MQTAATTKLQQAARLRPQAVPLLHMTVRLITRRPFAHCCLAAGVCRGDLETLLTLFVQSLGKSRS